MRYYTNDEIHFIIWSCKDWSAFCPYLEILEETQPLDDTQILKDCEEVYNE